jgi:hypothetical protein
MIFLELRFPADPTWTSVTHLLREYSYTKHAQICNESFQSVIDTLSFRLRYDQLILAKLLAAGASEQILLRAYTADMEPDFTGYVARSFRHETDDLPGDIVCEARDASGKLDVPLIADLTLPSSIADDGVSVYDCFTAITMAAGYAESDLDPYRPAAPEIVRSLYEQKDDLTYRDLLDGLLRDYGYVLTTTAEGKLTYFHWNAHPYILSGTVSGNVSVSESFSLQKADTVHDGIQVIWSQLGILDDAALFKQQLPIGSDGVPSGKVISAGGYFPEDADLIDSYQEYKQDWLDRPFLSRTTRVKNQDISLVTSENHHLVVVADAGITHTETFEPKRAKVRFHNPTGEALKLYVFEIWGKALFREQIRETLLPSTATDPERVPAEYIYTAEDAKNLAKGLYNRQQFGDIEYRFTLYERLYEPGERIHINQSDPALDTDALITELEYTDELPGFRYRAIGLSEFGELEAITTSYTASKAGEKGEKGESAVYVEIISHHGTIFRPAVVNTTLEARVYEDGEDVTERYLNADFRWVRSSDDAYADELWNSAHYSTGGKTLPISDADVYGRAVFFCQLLTKR